MKGLDVQDKISTLKNLLPPEINGWKAQGEDKLFGPETIFDYIDGAGEVYRSYNFEKLLVRRYAKEGKADLVADLFHMGNPEDAFGVFTHDLEGEDAGVGQGSTYKGGLLSFWKDCFFVSLYAEEETEETREAVMALGREVEAAIKGEGEKPALIYLLPLQELRKDTIRYFHNHMILNYHFFVADENILLLDQKTEAALGAYGEREKKFRLLVIRYTGPKKASRAFKNFKGVYMPEVQEKNIIQNEDGKWTAVSLKDEFLTAVFEASSRSRAEQMVKEVEKRMEKMPMTKKDRNKNQEQKRREG